MKSARRPFNDTHGYRLFLTHFLFCVCVYQFAATLWTHSHFSLFCFVSARTSLISFFIRITSRGRWTTHSHAWGRVDTDPVQQHLTEKQGLGLLFNGKMFLLSEANHVCEKRGYFSFAEQVARERTTLDLITVTSLPRVIPSGIWVCDTRHAVYQEPLKERKVVHTQKHETLSNTFRIPQRNFII